MTVLIASDVINSSGSAFVYTVTQTVIVSPGTDVMGSVYGITSSAQLSVVNGGFIYGSFGATLTTGSAALTVTNLGSGILAAETTAVYSENSLTLYNAGEISSDLQTIYCNAASGTTRIANDGRIIALSENAIYATNQLTLENRGVIQGNIWAFSNDACTINSTLGSVFGTIIGSNAGDSIIGGQVSCTLDGGAGNDALYANSTQAAADNRATTTFLAGSDNNALYGGSGFNIFNEGASLTGRDQVWGGLSKMADVTGYLNNTLSLVTSTRGAYVDLLDGDNLYFNNAAGNWTGAGFFKAWIQNVPNVNATSYADIVQMGGVGGRVDGGAGADALYSATGQDTFVYDTYSDSNTVGGYDTVVNFERGTDKIDISGFLARNGLGPTSLVISGVGNSSTVYIEVTPGTFNSATDLAFIVNSTGGVLTASDFIL